MSARSRPCNDGNQKENAMSISQITVLPPHTPFPNSHLLTPRPHALEHCYIAYRHSFIQFWSVTRSFASYLIYGSKVWSLCFVFLLHWFGWQWDMTFTGDACKQSSPALCCSGIEQLTKCIRTGNYLFILRSLIKFHARHIEQTLESEWCPYKYYECFINKRTVYY